jgi:hypothetical protein
VPVHADHRLDGRALVLRVAERARLQVNCRRVGLQTRTLALRSVGHEEDGIPVVLAAGMLLGEVSLGLLDQVVLVLAGDRLAARAVQMGLHIFTIAYVATMVSMDLSTGNRSALNPQIPLACLYRRWAVS